MSLVFLLKRPNPALMWMFAHSCIHLLRLTSVIELSLYQVVCQAWGYTDIVNELNAQSLVAGVGVKGEDRETDVLFNKHLMCVVCPRGVHPGFGGFWRKCPVQPGVQMGIRKGFWGTGTGAGESSDGQTRTGVGRHEGDWI